MTNSAKPVIPNARPASHWIPAHHVTRLEEEPESTTFCSTSNVKQVVLEPIMRTMTMFLTVNAQHVHLHVKTVSLESSVSHVTQV